MSQLKKHPSDLRMSQNSTKITTPETNIRQHLKHWGLEDSNFLLARSGQVRIASLGESKYHPVCLRLWTSLEYGYRILWEALEVALFHSFPESEGPIIIYLHIYSHVIVKFLTVCLPQESKTNIHENPTNEYMWRYERYELFLSSLRSRCSTPQKQRQQMIAWLSSKIKTNQLQTFYSFHKLNKTCVLH